MDLQPAFQFESDTVKPAVWVRCRVWEAAFLKYDGEPGEVFEIGEPVWLNNRSMVQPKDHLYWIRSFDYNNGDSWVRLSWMSPEVPADETSFIPVRPAHLQKLPDMVRIAAEASRPIP